MILDDVQDRLIQNVNSELDRNAIKGDRYRWPGGIIPYKFDEAGNFSESKKMYVKEYAERFSKQMEGCLTIR